MKHIHINIFESIKSFCVPIYIHIYLHSYIYTYTYIFKHIYIYFYICIHRCVQIKLHTCIYSHIFIYKFVYTHARIFTHSNTCIHMYIHAYLRVKIQSYIEKVRSGQPVCIQLFVHFRGSETVRFCPIEGGVEVVPERKPWEVPQESVFDRGLS